MTNEEFNNLIKIYGSKVNIMVDPSDGSFSYSYQDLEANHLEELLKKASGRLTFQQAVDKLFEDL